MIAGVGDEIWQVISQEPISFFIGAFFGFIAANRWQLTRRSDAPQKGGSE